MHSVPVQRQQELNSTIAVMFEHRTHRAVYWTLPTKREVLTVLSLGMTLQYQGSFVWWHAACVAHSWLCSVMQIA